MFSLDRIIEIKFIKMIKKILFWIAQSKYKFAKHFVNVPKSVFFMMSLHFQNNWVAQKNIFFINLKNLISIIWSSKNIGMLCSRIIVLAGSCSKSQIYTFHCLYISLSTRLFMLTFIFFKTISYLSHAVISRSSLISWFYLSIMTCL